MEFLVKIVYLAAMLTAIGGDSYTVTDQVYLDIMIADRPAGRIVIGLFGEVAPKTVKNFMTLATTGVAGKTYKGGDIENGDGTGSISIYGKYFEDENFEISHSTNLLVSMANAGKDTNGCQFFITTIGTTWLDGQHTVFGKVIDGEDVVFKIEQVKTDSDDVPVKPVVIFDCGIIPASSPFTVSTTGSDIWAWLKASAVPLTFSFVVLGTLHYMMKKLDVTQY